MLKKSRATPVIDVLRKRTSNYLAISAQKRAELQLTGSAQKGRKHTKSVEAHKKCGDHNWFKALKKSEITITVTG